MKKEFKDPGNEYRSAPFWSWNDRLNPEELRRQVRDMHDHGIGGFFMHSREGLETDYLSPEWWECVRKTVAEAKKLGMKAYVYDEDRWPSGFAGGLVPARSKEYQKKTLVMKRLKPGQKIPPKTVCAFRAKMNRGNLVSATRLDLEAPTPKPRKDEKTVCFVMETAAPSDWYNGYPYADNLNPESVRAFIDITYEAYYREIGREFGRTVPAVFTDEPHFQEDMILAPGHRVPWTAIFPGFFQKRRGYDILDKLPHFFLEGRDTASVRHDYWLTLTELFADSYSRQIGEWCEKHNVALTGHYLAEHDFAMQIGFSGAVMPQYEYQQMPGIDLLRERIEEVLTVKQCTSVARQFGRDKVLSELYGCTGWDFTFEGMKWIGDWQYALGINERCQHLALYSIKGCRKRDYPPSFNYNTTWWKHNKVIEDYFARASLVLSTGTPVRDVLLIHNISSGWTAHKSGREIDPAVQEWFHYLNDTSKALLGLHRDFDYGDEILMEKYGKALSGRIKINKATYNVVVLPPALNLRSSTVALLQTYLAKGGRLVAIKPLPTLVDGCLSKDIDRLLKHKNVALIDDHRELATSLDDIEPPRIKIQNESGQEITPIIYQMREASDRSIFFLANTDRECAYQARVWLSGKGRLEEWDLLSNDVKEVPYNRIGKFAVFDAQFKPTDSKLYVLNSKQSPRKRRAATVELTASDTVYLGPTWRVSRTEPNALPLDVCRFSLNGSKLSQPMPVWKAQRTIRETFGLQPVYMNGIQQRWVWLKKKKDIGRADVEMHFAFSVKDIPSKSVYLVLEGSEHFTIQLNGKAVQKKNSGWWLDRAFHKVKLPKLTEGENTLVLRCHYKNEMEIEDCYLIGDFGVDAATHGIVKERKNIRTGDWRYQGYPFYAGGIVYTTDFQVRKSNVKNVILTVGAFAGTTVSITVNGKHAGDVPWKAADGIDISKCVKAGRNTISIEVAGSPRNLLGPLHYADSEPGWIDCDKFRSETNEYTPEYVTVPYGLTGQTRIEFV